MLTFPPAWIAIYVTEAEPAGCISPFGPTFGRSKSLPAILSVHQGDLGGATGLFRSINNAPNPAA